MKSLKSQLKDAIDNNKTKSESAIKHIQEQTYNLTTDSDYLTIDRKPRESRREAALKMMKAAKEGNLDKIDEDLIYQEHEVTKTQNENFEIDQKDFDQLSPADRLIALRKLMGNTSNEIDTSEKDSNQSFENSNQSFNNSANAEINKDVNELKNNKKYKLIHKKIILYKNESSYYNDQYEENYKKETQKLTFWEKIKAKFFK